MSVKSWQKVLSVFALLGLLLSLVQPGGVSAAAPAASSLQGPAPEVEAKLLEQFRTEGTAGYLIYFRESPDLSAAAGMDWEARGWYVMNTLQAAAERSQARVRAYLDGQGVPYQSFWIDNVIAVDNSSRTTFEGLMAFSEIESLKARRTMGLIEPEKVEAAEATLAVEPNISHVNAPAAWALGINGAGRVVASIDTGVRYTHQALVSHYRGNLGGGTFNHNYNWWDPYGDHPNSPADDNGHGSHTMGTMIGDDGGANQIGMAPGAQWMACRGCNTSSCSDSALLSCAQFMAAPTNLAGTNPNPAMRPDAVNNSWGDCGQSYDNWYQGVVDAWHAAGIYPVFSNGNASNCGYSTPPGLNTVGNPARYGNVTGVGSSGQSNGQYATHSNWGPTDNPDTVNPRGYPYLKPQVIAPGVNIRSSVNSSDSSYASYGGTSMSAPHVTGLIALMWQAAPCLVGDYAATETMIEQTATPVPYASGGTPPPGPGNVPNYATGWGEINALAAVQAALNYCGDSALTGQVTEHAKGPGDPIAGAVIAATNLSGTFQTVSNAQGYYTLTLWADTYDVAVSAFGYELWTADDVVVSGTVTLNPQLTLADWYTVTGTVTDANTGWPLYAKITINGYPGDPIWTDPATGAYSISLPEGVAYTFVVEAFYGGYLPASRAVGPLTGAATENFALNVDTVACNAPGYALSGGFFEFFDSVTAPALPAGWAVVDVSGTSGNWATNAGTRYPSGYPAHTPPNVAYFNSYSASSGNSTRLYYQGGLNMTSMASPTLTFWMFRDDGFSSNNDYVQVQVSTDGGVSWVNVGSQFPRYSASGDYWEQKTVDLSLYSAETNLRLGFLGVSAFGNDIHIDDVVLGGTPTCVAPSGGLVIGNVYDAQTLAAMNNATVESDAGESTTTLATPADPAVDDGFYYLYSDPGSHVFTATYPLYGPAVATVNVVAGAAQVQDFYLAVGQLVAAPSLLEVSVPMGMTTTVPLTLSNVGGAAVNWEIREKDLGYQPTARAGEDVLVVRRDTTMAAAMEAALTANGYTFLGVTEAAFQAMPVSDLLNYQAVFFAGTTGYSGAPTASETKLIEYLDAGGSLYISDNDLGYYRNTSTFYGTYLQATYVADNGGDLLTGEDIMAGLDLDVTSDPYPDSFTVGAEGVRIFKWSTSSDAGGVAVERNNYKAIYTSFDFQYIAGTANQNALVLRVMNFLGAADAPWLSESPTTGTLNASSDQLIDVTFDASVPAITQPGKYLAELQVKNDTPYGKLIVPVTMIVQAPADWGKLNGTVTSLGYCDANPAPLEGAQVFIQASNGMTWTLETNPAGYYSIWLDEDYAPITVTVTAAQHEGGLATGVDITGQMTTTVNFDLRWLKPCVSVDPNSLHATLPFGEQVTRTLTIANDGAVALDFQLSEVDEGYSPNKGRAYPTMSARSADVSDFNPNFVAGSGNALDFLGINSWGTGAAMPGSGRYRAGSACNENCTQVWVFGGGAGSTGSNTVMYYDTATDTWTTSLATIPNAAQNWQAVFLDGKFYLPGGYNSSGHNNWLQIYDPATNTWTMGANMPQAITPMAAGWNGKLYIFGGNPGPSNSVAMYDPATNTWTTGLAPMPTARAYGRALTVGDRIFVIGGVSGSTVLGTVEVYDPAANTWTTLPSLGTARGDASVFWVGDYVYAAGGIPNYSSWAGSTAVERYYLPNFPAGSWEALDPAPAGFGASAYGCAADKMWSIGGQDASAAATTINRYQDEGLPCNCGGGGGVPWLSEAPITGTVSADGGSLVVEVTFDASVPEVNLPGNYYATLKVKSNDPLHGGLSLPVTMTVQAPPDYAIVNGTVTGLGYCDLNPEPLEGLDVIIEGITHTYTATTNANGEYIYWIPESEGPLNLSVDGAALHYSFAMAGPVPITAQMTTTVDFELRWLMPCVGVDPAALNVTVAQGYSMTVPVELDNNGAAALTWELVERPNTKSKDNIIQDGGFEAGTPNPYWDESSTNYGTPICDETSCGTGGGTAGAHSGTYWAWFGGGGSILPEIGTLSQDVLIPPGTATLSFWFWIGTTGSPAADTLKVMIDGDVVFLATGDQNSLYPSYTLVEVDISAYADGNVHTVEFEGIQTTSTTTNFNVDDVVLDSQPFTDIPWLSEFPISGTLGADSAFEVAVTFDTMTYTLGTYTGLLQLKSNDPLHATLNVPVTMTIVAPAYGVALSDDMVAWGLPGATVTYTVEVTNTGNAPDTFNLTLGAHTYPTTLDQSTVTLPPGVSTSVHVTVQIPAGAAGNAHDTVQLTATSQGNPARHDTATLSTYVTPVRGVALVAVDDTLSGSAGTTVEYSLIITNTGNTTDTFTLAASGNNPAWVVQLPVTSVELGAGESATVIVRVTIPAGAVSGDSDTVTITATGSGAATAHVNLTTTATGYRLFLPLILKNFTGGR